MIKPLKAVTFKMDPQQLKLLEAISSETRIPKSALIREGIDLLIRQHKEDIVSAELQKDIALMLDEDKELLQRLAE